LLKLGAILTFWEVRYVYMNLLLKLGAILTFWEVSCGGLTLFDPAGEDTAVVLVREESHPGFKAVSSLLLNSELLGGFKHRRPMSNQIFG
jgi:hypothetical protein